MDHWDDNSRKDSIVVTADSDKTIMAYFEKGQSVVVNSYKVAMKNGTVDKKDGQLVLTATDQQVCSYIVNNGQIAFYNPSGVINANDVTEDVVYEPVNRNIRVLVIGYVSDTISDFPSCLEPTDYTSASVLLGQVTSDIKSNGGFVLESFVNSLGHLGFQYTDNITEPNQSQTSEGFTVTPNKFEVPKKYLKFYHYKICSDLVSDNATDFMLIPLSSQLVNFSGIDADYGISATVKLSDNEDVFDESLRNDTLTVNINVRNYDV